MTGDYLVTVGDVRAVVREFLAELGELAGDVADCVIDPWGVTVTAYVRDPETGLRPAWTDGTALKRSKHYPMDQVIKHV